MNAQAELNKVLGSVTSGIGTAIKVGQSIGGIDAAAKAGKSIGGIDQKMAAKARKIAQQKINAIYANKEISSKAKTRRIGKVLDEMGGNK